MNKLYIDFESYSKIDIKQQGSKHYTTDDSTNIICLGYGFNNDPVKLWTPADEFPKDVWKHVLAGGLVYAHNAIFDYRLWNNVLVRDFDNIPTLFLSQMVDTMALCQTYTIPARLSKAGEALNIKLKKMEEGVRLINKCCVPNKKGQQPMYHDMSSIFQELFLYCKRDVEAMREIVNKLPRPQLLPIEQKIWELTANMNETGLPIDTETVHNILVYLEKYIQNKMEQVGTITEGFIQTVNQTTKILEWCSSKGLDMPNLQAATVQQALEISQLPDEVTKLLKLRQELGRTSTAKFKKLINLEYYDTVHDNLQYHGTSTGRWAGRGFQMQNLPRAKVDDPEKYIKAFNQGETVEDPVTISKALIRPVILAPPKQMLIVSDYSSIENRVLAWLANDQYTLDLFAQGLDQYKDMATYVYNVAYNNVTSAQRQMAKMLILGCGYGMGKIRFREEAQNWGVELTTAEADNLVDKYRERYDKIVQLWHKLKQVAISTVTTKQKHTYEKITFGIAKVNGLVWLGMLLPSGKAIYYMNPKVEDRYIPGYEQMGKVATLTHMGINPYNKKWMRLAASPGRITENATQATAREIMAQGLLNVHKCMPNVKLIGTCHDEALSLINKDLATQDTMDKFNQYLCNVEWARDLPLAAEGYFAKRYKKG